jgi:hypothetical protein
VLLIPAVLSWFNLVMNGLLLTIVCCFSELVLASDFLPPVTMAISVNNQLRPEIARSSDELRLTAWALESPDRALKILKAESQPRGAITGLRWGPQGIEFIQISENFAKKPFTLRLDIRDVTLCRAVGLEGNSCASGPKIAVTDSQLEFKVLRKGPADSLAQNTVGTNGVIGFEELTENLLRDPEFNRSYRLVRKVLTDDRKSLWGRGLSFFSQGDLESATEAKSGLYPGFSNNNLDRNLAFAGSHLGLFDKRMFCKQSPTVKSPSRRGIKGTKLLSNNLLQIAKSNRCEAIRDSFITSLVWLEFGKHDETITSVELNQFAKKLKSQKRFKQLFASKQTTGDQPDQCDNEILSRGSDALDALYMRLPSLIRNDIKRSQFEVRYRRDYQCKFPVGGFSSDYSSKSNHLDSRACYGVKPHKDGRVRPHIILVDSATNIDFFASAIYTWFDFYLDRLILPALRISLKRKSGLTSKNVMSYAAILRLKRLRDAVWPDFAADMALSGRETVVTKMLRRFGLRQVKQARSSALDNALLGRLMAQHYCSAKSADRLNSNRLTLTRYRLLKILEIFDAPEFGK